MPTSTLICNAAISEFTDYFLLVGCSELGRRISYEWESRIQSSDSVAQLEAGYLFINLFSKVKTELWRK